MRFINFAEIAPNGNFPYEHARGEGGGGEGYLTNIFKDSIC